MTGNRQIVLVLLCFALLGVVRHLHQFGEDLGSSYLGCRLLAAGQGDHLYVHSPIDFAQVNDRAWNAMAIETGFFPLRMIHPYVQTPLWAWSLEPVCTHVRYRVFCNAFMVLLMMCASGTIWLIARNWTPSLFHPGWIALIYAVLYVSEPFKYAVFLAQTHILYVFMTVLALMLTESRRPIAGGALLAFAAAVKITPGLLLIYWLLTRQYRAALSFVATFLALTGLTVAILGSGLMHDYLQSLAYNSNVLLLAFNNQSFVSWWVNLSAPRVEMLHWYSYQLPAGLKLLSEALSVGAAVAGGLLDRRASNLTVRNQLPLPPYGAVLTLIAATVFAPIAWIHYFVVLLIPAMLLAAVIRDRRSRVWIAVLVVLILLNLYPVSIGAVHVYYKSWTILRSQFYAGVLAMASMAVLAYQRLPRPSAASRRVLADASSQGQVVALRTAVADTP